MLASNVQFAVYVLCTILGGLTALWTNGWDRLIALVLIVEVVALTWFADFLGIPWFAWCGPPAWAALITFALLALSFAVNDRIAAKEALRRPEV